MKHIPSPDSSLLVLQRGERLHEALIKHAKEQNLKSAWLSGLGGAGAVTLGFYDIQTKAYAWKTLDGPTEIVSLTGNLAIVDGEPFWHIHGVFSGRDFQAVGGHVKEMTVGLTCELHITPLEAPVTRVFDDETGLKLIKPSAGS